MYHLNPGTGEPGPCNAKRGNCPYAPAADHFETASEAQVAYEEQMNESTIPAAQKAVSKTGKKIDNVDHTSLKRIPEALAGEGRKLPKDSYFTVHSGLMNPTTGEGDDFGHWINGGVILAKSDGKRPRIVTGGFSPAADYEDELGRAVAQTKMRLTGSDALTDGLYVVGLIDKDGNRYGWVPDKKIQYFIFK